MDLNLFSSLSLAVVDGKNVVERRYLLNVLIKFLDTSHQSNLEPKTRYSWLVRMDLHFRLDD
jgi:hypothetical protein